MNVGDLYMLQLLKTTYLIEICSITANAIKYTIPWASSNNNNLLADVFDVSPECFWQFWQPILVYSQQQEVPHATQ
jgi:hypothetical protein